NTLGGDAPWVKGFPRPLSSNLSVSFPDRVSSGAVVRLFIRTKEMESVEAPAGIFKCLPVEVHRTRIYQEDVYDRGSGKHFQRKGDRSTEVLYLWLAKG